MDRSRSRTRSDDHPYDLPAPNSPDDNTQEPPLRASRHLVWNGTLILRQLRRVLALYSESPRSSSNHGRTLSDAMSATRIFTLPDLQDAEEEGLFTYARLLQPTQLPAISTEILLSGITQYIFHTWGVQINPDDLDLRRTDIRGDTFALHNYQKINRLLKDHRPSWCHERDARPLLPSTRFTSPSQPYIMRMSCHKALPPGYLP